MPPNQINFETDKNWEKMRANLYGEVERSPKTIELFMKLGLDKKQSYYAIALIVIVSLFISFQMLKSTFFVSTPVYFEDFPQEQLDMMTETERNALPRKSR